MTKKIAIEIWDTIQRTAEREPTPPPFGEVLHRYAEAIEREAKLTAPSQWRRNQGLGA